METKFQTSFIPKKSVASIGGVGVAKATPRRSSSLFMILAVMIFIISLGAVGGMYLWKEYLVSKQENYKKQLVQKEKQFDSNLIQQLKRENVKIDLAKQLLDKHLAVSSIFSIISQFTIRDVRFLSMDVSAPNDQSSDLKFDMDGYGTSLQAVAFQSDVLGQLEQYGLRDIVKNPIMSDPSLDASGAVSFGFTATINPNSLSYEKLISSMTNGNGQELPQASSTTE
jgi:hypothetical protein